MRILGVDPGVATGIAVYDTEERKALHLEIVNMGEKALTDHLGLLAFKYHPIGRSVYEDFIPRWGQKFDITPIKLIGAMNTMHRLWDKVKPAEHKALIKDKPLNALFKDACEKIGAGHSRDALRLCLYVAVARLRDEGTIQLLKENK